MNTMEKTIKSDNFLKIMFKMNNYFHTVIFSLLLKSNCVSFFLVVVTLLVLFKCKYLIASCSTAY